MAYPTDKETFRRVVNQELPEIAGDIVDEDDQNLPADFLERLQDTFGYGIKMGYASVKAFFDWIVTQIGTIAGKVSKSGDTMGGDLTFPVGTKIILDRSEISLGGGAGNNGTFGIGIGAEAKNNYTVGIGIGNEAKDNYSYGIGIGKSAYRNYDHGVGVGRGTVDNYTKGVGVGHEATKNYNHGIGIGRKALENHTYGIGIGYEAQNNDNYSIGIGYRAKATANDSIAIGKNCTNTIANTFKIPDNYSFHCAGIPVYANNAAAIVGGLTVGAFYRTGGDPDPVCVVH